jgi:predicted kinase
MKCYQLVGVPGSGKSTWVSSQPWAVLCARVGTDKWVELYAAEVGKTYSEVFEGFMPSAVSLMTKEVNSARDMKRDIVWDQTSTTVKSRARKFRMLPDYEHIAVVFSTPPIPLLTKRLASRPGKHIPWSVVSGMINGFEMPSKEEGFVEIWHINNY